MSKMDFSRIIQVVTIVSAIVTPLLVAYFGYYNAQKIETVKTGYDYAQYKLVKLQEAYEKINIPLDADLEKSISSQLQDRHHATSEIWEIITPYLSNRQSEKIKDINNIGNKINDFYLKSARAKQKGEEYILEDTKNFSSLLYEYHEKTRKVIADEISGVIEILEEAIED